MKVIVIAAICSYMLGAILGSFAVNWYVISQPGYPVYYALSDAFLFGVVLSGPAVAVVGAIFGGFVAYLWNRSESKLTNKREGPEVYFEN